MVASKRTDAGGKIGIFDVMRGMTDGSIARLYANTAGADLLVLGMESNH